MPPSLGTTGDAGHAVEFTVPHRVIARDVTRYLDRRRWLPVAALRLPSLDKTPPRLWRLHATVDVTSAETAALLCAYGRPSHGDPVRCGVEAVTVTDPRLLALLVPIAAALTSIRVVPGERQSAWAVREADGMDLTALEASPAIADCSFSLRDVSPAAALTAFCALRRLDLSGRPFVSDATVAPIAAVGGTLTDLDLSGGCFTDGLAGTLTALPLLVALTVRSCMLPRRFVALLAASAPELVRLDVSGSSVDLACDCPTPEPLPALRHLAAAAATDDAGVRCVPQRWPRLRSVDVTACDVSAAGIIAVVVGLPGLETLRMAHLSIPQAKAQAVTEALTAAGAAALQELDVAESFADTTALVAALRDVLPPLRRRSFVFNDAPLPMPFAARPPSAPTTPEVDFAVFSPVFGLNGSVPHSTTTEAHRPRRPSMRRASASMLTAAASFSGFGFDRSVTAAEALGGSLALSPPPALAFAMEHRRRRKCSVSGAPLPPRRGSMSHGPYPTPPAQGVLCGLFRAFTWSTA